MFSLYLECRQEEKDLLIAELWDEGSTGITEVDEQHLRAFFERDADAAGLLQRFAAFGPQWEREEVIDWVAVARAKIQPMLVGSRFFLAPQWRLDPAPAGRLRIEINPGQAFGTGVHETTQLCLEALEREIRPGMRVVDVGTGSGILAEAAALLGARSVFACDLDPDAVAVARLNVEAIFVGSIQAVRPGSAELAIANISPAAIQEMASDLIGCVSSAGAVICSGFETHDVPHISQAVEGAGAVVREVQTKNSWALIVAATRTPCQPA